jgi:hypothetical protein
VSLAFSFFHPTVIESYVLVIKSGVLIDGAGVGTLSPDKLTGDELPQPILF